MSDIDINRVLQNIKELQDQNAIDFQQWKRLGQEIERLEGKIKTTDKHYNLLMKKIKSDYEALRKIIVDENVQVQLNNKIDETKKDIENNLQHLNNKIQEVAAKVTKSTRKSMKKILKESRIRNSTRCAACSIRNTAMRIS